MSVPFRYTTNVLEKVWLPIGEIHPAPENDTLYGPIDPADPAIQRMAREMRDENRSRTLLTVSADHYVMDGHRRLVAAKLAGLRQLECIKSPLRHGDPAFVKELVRYNNQRIKTNEVLFRETVVTSAHGDAHQALKKAKAKRAELSADDIERIEFTETKVHSSISEFRRPFLKAVIRILNENVAYRPLTVRQIHYRLLNNPPLKHSSKDGRMTRRGVPSSDSTYKNDVPSYNALIQLVKDARLDGYIPWDVIDDPTRPVTIWNVHNSTQPYIEKVLEGFLRGYARNLLQSQPNHIELFAEKKTLNSVLRPIASRFCLPFTIGSGVCSIAPIKKLVERFKKSGKEKLLILAISDLDPAGVMIGRSFCQRLRDYFNLENVNAFRVTLTLDQVNRYELSAGGNVDDKDDVNKETFRAEYGDNTYEVEALEPSVLSEIVEEAIEGVLDTDAFNREVEAEEADEQFLEARRRKLLEFAATL